MKCRWNRGWAASQALDRRGLVGGVVVADQVDVQVGGHLLVELGQELPELGGAVPAVQRPITLPVATSNAANRLVMPWRT